MIETSAATEEGMPPLEAALAGAGRSASPSFADRPLIAVLIPLLFMATSSAVSSASSRSTLPSPSSSRGSLADSHPHDVLAHLRHDPEESRAASSPFGDMFEA